MKLRYFPYHLEFRYPFNLSVGSRKTTPVVFLELERDGITGYGEAALPPYLGESQEDVIRLMKRIDVRNLEPFDPEKSLNYLDSLEPDNNAAKAAVDIAFHDLYCKTNNLSLSRYYNLEANAPPPPQMGGGSALSPFGGPGGQVKRPLPHSTYTISIDSDEVIKKKIKENQQFKIYKIKLGGSDDRKIIETFRKLSQKPFCVDVNQGWKDKVYALEMIGWLMEKGCLFAEQPLPKENEDDLFWLKEKSPMPLIADEAIKRLKDMERISGLYHGINIKLMKSAGIYEALKMMRLAKEKKMKIVIGCMSESSCAVTAAAHLSRLADWADLDGPYLIRNDPFDGMKIEEGRVVIPDRPGIGAVPNGLYYPFTL